MSVSVPSGHAGTAHLRLLYHEFQVYPLSRDEDYHGDGNEFRWSDNFVLDGEPFELKAVGWNTDTVNNHVFLVSLEVTRIEKVMTEQDNTILSELQDMITTGTLL